MNQFKPINPTATRPVGRHVFLLAALLVALLPTLQAQNVSSALPALPAIPDAAARAVSGRDGWFFLPAELRHLATAAKAPALSGAGEIPDPR